MQRRSLARTASLLLLGAGGALALLALSAFAAPPPALPPGAHAADARAAHEHRANEPELHSHSEDIEEWLRIWDDPQPDASGEPERVIDALRLRPGLRLVFLGAGTGYFDARLARALGPQGLLYALESDSALVRMIGERAKRDATPIVRPLWTAAFEPTLPNESVDRLLLVDFYHHLSGGAALLERWRSRLRPDGLVVIVEWRPGELARGPAAADKIAPEAVTDQMRAAGFQVVERKSLRYHDILVFRPQLQPRPAAKEWHGCAVVPKVRTLPASRARC